MPNGPTAEIPLGEGDAVRSALETYADEIVASELEEAFDQLEAGQSRSPETIEVIVRMATRIRDGILAGPLDTLEVDPRPDECEAVIDLFNLDPSLNPNVFGTTGSRLVDLVGRHERDPGRS